MNTNTWWGLRIKAMRRALDLTQSELATLTGIAGVDASLISRIERGKRNLSLELGLALSRALGVPSEVLFANPESSEEKAAA